MKHTWLCVILCWTLSLPGGEPDVSDLSLQDRVGQVFFSIAYGESELTPDTKAWIHRCHIGNVHLLRFANGQMDRERVTLLTRDIHNTIVQETGIVPLIAVDHEGGRVLRLSEGFTKLPSQGSVAAEGLPWVARQNALTGAKQLFAAGINMNFAPVVDVNLNPDNPVIGDRSFGDNADTVVLFAKETIQGLHEGGVLTTLKHFPGHGDVSVNSHVGLPVVSHTKEQLENIDLKPFHELKDSTDAIMTAHIMVPSVDKDHPATFSKILLTDLLRNQWKYQGVVIADSLVMRGAVPAQGSFDEVVAGVSQAAVDAFLAGCDLLIVSKAEWADVATTPEQDLLLIERVMANFRQAVENGVISEDRLNASVTRILALKSRQQFPLKFLPQSSLSPQRQF